MWFMPNTIRLIERYRSLPELWDPDNVGYKDREKKKLALKSMADEFGVDVLEVERKLKGLKTQFARELVRSSSGNYKSAWFGFELLQFLRKSKKSFDAYISGVPTNQSQEDENSGTLKIPDFGISSENGIDCNNSEDENTSSFTLTEEPQITDDDTVFPTKRSIPYATTICNPPKRSRMYDGDDENTAEFFHRTPQGLNNVFQDKERDEFAVFGEHVANQLRRINDSYARSVAQYYISNTLFQAEMTNYNKNLVFEAPVDFTLFHNTTTANK